VSLNSLLALKTKKLGTRLELSQGQRAYSVGEGRFFELTLPTTINTRHSNQRLASDQRHRTVWADSDVLGKRLHYATFLKVSIYNVFSREGSTPVFSDSATYVKNIINASIKVNLFKQNYTFKVLA